jgi:phosphoribosylformylglycinamidine (FGAM) synthase-like enzyme
MSEGGLGITLAECAIRGPYADSAVGAMVNLNGYADGLSAHELLFGEDGARAIVSVLPSRSDALLALAKEHGVPAFVAGMVGEQNGALLIQVAETRMSWRVSELREAYYEAIPRRMQTAVADRG